MKDAIKKKRAVYLTVRLLTPFLLLCTCIYAYYTNGLSWFANNDKVNATGGQIGVKAPSDTEIIIYRKTGSTVSRIDSTVELDMYPGQEETLIILVKKSPATFTLNTANYQVCYYALQHFSIGQDTAFDEYVTPYMRAGEYTDGGGNVLLDYYDVTSAQYMRFVKPVSNAIKVTGCYTGAITAATDDAAAATTALTNTIATLQTPTPLFVTPTYSTNAAAMLGRGVDAYETLAADTGTSYSLAGCTYGQSDYCTAIVLKLQFDSEEYPTADITLNNTQTNITCENSNPFMYQKLRFSFTVSR